MRPNLIKATIGLTVTALAALVAGTFLILRDDPGAPIVSSPRPTPSPSTWEVVDGPDTTYRSEEFGYTVTYPSDWHRAEESLTPNLGDPKEILSLANFPLAPKQGRCAQLPAANLSGMTTTQALITLQERGSSASYPQRPLSFPGQKMIRRLDCIFHPRRMDVWWVPFDDGDRSFYALVALGKDVPRQARSEAWSVLNNLTLETMSADASGLLPVGKASSTDGHIDLGLPDGSRVRMSFSEDLDLRRRFEILPAWSGIVGRQYRDIFFRFESPEWLTEGRRLVATYTGALGRPVELWRTTDEQKDPRLVWTVGDWYLGVDVGAPGMNEHRIQMWVDGLVARVEESGFVTLRARPPLMLSPRGNAGPSINFWNQRADLGSGLLITRSPCGDGSSGITNVEMDKTSAVWCQNGHTHLTAVDYERTWWVRDALDSVRVEFLNQ